MNVYSERIITHLEHIAEQISKTRSAIFSGSVRGELFDLFTGAPQKDKSPHEYLAHAISDISVPNNNDGGTSNVNRYVGWFAVDRSITNEMERLNQLKADMITITEMSRKEGVSWRSIRPLLIKAGFPACHWLQLTRKINIVPAATTESIRFSFSRYTSSVQLMSLDEARAWLRSKEADDILSIMNERRFPASTLVRIRRPIATHVRANIATKGGENRMLFASLPIILDAPDWNGFVKLNLPKTRRKFRDDMIIADDEIALPFIEQGYLLFNHAN